VRTLSIRFLPSAAVVALALAGCQGPSSNTASLPLAANAAPRSGVPTHFVEHRVRRSTSGGETLQWWFQNQPGVPQYPGGQVALDSFGNVYGTTYGVQGSQSGAVYQFTPGLNPQLTVIYSEYGPGLLPQTGVTMGPEGSIYFTFQAGGTGSCLSFEGCGALEKLKASRWTPVTLHSFDGADGDDPSGPPLVLNGTIYGVAYGGGSNNDGVAYSVSDTGTSYTIIHQFNNANAGPQGPLVADSSGVLYGTTEFGGSTSCGCGEVFKLTPSGSTYTFSVVYKFNGTATGDGANPVTGVTLYDGRIYGTTAAGGSSDCPSSGSLAAGCGTIFEITPDVTINGYSETVLRELDPVNSDVRKSPSGLTLGAGGVFYGTTVSGGNCTGSDFPNGCGSIFSITSSGTFTKLYQFQGPPTDGANPLTLNLSPGAAGAGVAVDSSGTLWGATRFGCYCSNKQGWGTIYSFSGSGSGGSARRHHH